MGKAREAIAIYLSSRDKALRFTEFAHQKYLAAMSAGAAYTNAQDLVTDSAEQFRDILYNIKGSTRKRVNSPEDVKKLWEEVIGKPWPTSGSKEKDKEGTDTSNKDN